MSSRQTAAIPSASRSCGNRRRARTASRAASSAAVPTNPLASSLELTSPQYAATRLSPKALGAASGR